jgi:hypothetical protein
VLSSLKYQEYLPNQTMANLFPLMLQGIIIIIIIIIIIPIIFNRWLELVSSDTKEPLSELMKIAAEPIYICARSSNWEGSPSPFTVSFQPQFLRSSDRNQCILKIAIHFIFIIFTTSIWLLPYLVASICAVLTYIHGKYHNHDKLFR